MPMHDANVIVLGLWGRLLLAVGATWLMGTYATSRALFRHFCRDVNRGQ